ncbi:D-mannose binding lectin [Nitzschia inconspicua]|uniref:D-mannose binding lectin n=1 Tax=Nitzschia inconspicua TaxID=303405 RepID=A0A9K3PFB2_9STRA|nr:D-mannose binding lectin [Nitzschia inconspicua]
MTKQNLGRGEFKPSPNSDYQVGLDSNGELVVIDIKSNTKTWRSVKSGGQVCIMQDDGNLVVRDSASSAIWSTATGGNPGARLTIDDTGMASIMLGTNELWNLGGTTQVSIDVARPAQNPNKLKFDESVILNPLQSLPKGRFALSPAGNYKVGLNSSGNLLFQDSGNRVLWDAKVSGGVEAYMQADGNFVVRDSSQRLIWTTHTSGNNGARLVIDDGGRLSVVLGSTPIWMEGLPRGKYTGKYSSDDPRVVDEHLEALEYAFTDVAIASWWGPGTQKLSRISLLMDETIAQNSQIKWTVYYEEEFTQNPSVEKIRDDLNYLRKWFAWHPAWAHIDEKPVVFVYNESGCTVSDRWKQGVAAADGDWYVVMKLFPGFKACGTQPNSWHQYGPASDYIHIQGASSAVSPGFWRADHNNPE